jgi:hypothetical protein
MMIEKLDQSSGNILGYKVIGKITKQDFATVAAELETLFEQEGDVRLLLELEAFKGEEIKAQSDKRRFRGDYREKIPKLAIVGDQKWQEWLLPFIDMNYYNRETQFFPSGESEAAWEWIHI